MFRKCMIFRREVFVIQELYFNMFKIKYSKLDELLQEFEFERGEEVYIFINLECILKKLTSSITDRENVIQTSKRNIILTSCVFNLIAHYRYYFHKKAICSRVFIYGPESIDMDYINRYYNKDYRTKMMLLNTNQ